MGKVFFSVTMSLDGFIAPEESADDTNLERWMAQWGELQKWAFPQKWFRETLQLGEGGETGADNTMAEETFRRTGVSIMGKRMFDAGEFSWPEEAPFHSPVFVLTHQVREPWPRPGGTTFYFVNDGIESALDQARAAADGRDIRIAGGADVIQQYLGAGLVEEFNISLSPVLLGRGTRLFDGLGGDGFRLSIEEVIDSPQVTHLRYYVDD